MLVVSGTVTARPEAPDKMPAVATTGMKIPLVAGTPLNARG